MKSPRLPVRTWLPAIAGLLLGLLCHRALRIGNRSGIHDATSSRPTRAHPSQAANPPLATGPTTAFLQRIPSASAEECEAMVLDCLNQMQRDKELELEAIFRRWLAFESPEAILKKVSDFDGQWRSDWNASFFQAWVALDEKAAMADTKHSQLNPARALFAIQHADPNFASYCVNTSHSLSFEYKAQAALTVLARERPDIARLIADAKLPEGLKSLGITAVARGLAMNDPEAAISWLQSLHLANPGNHIAIVFSEWLKTDPTAAGKARERLGLTKIGLGDAVRSKAMETMNGPGSAEGQLSLALHRDPFVDVAGLYQKLIEVGADFKTKGYTMAAINQDGWYGVDPEADALAAAQLPPGKARDFLMSVICENWAAHDHEAALRYADAHGLESRAITTLKNKPTDAMRQLVLSAPEEHFVNLFGSGETKGVNREQLNALAKEWSAADPIAVANWLITQNFPGRDDLGGAEAASFRSNAFGYYWAGNDPLGASRWMEALPDSPQKSSAWSAMEESVRRYSPDLAFSLSAAYLDGDSRERSLTRDLEAVRDDIGLPAALELLKSPDLSADESAALAASLNAGKGGDK